MRCASRGLAWLRILLGALLAFTVSEAQAQGPIKIGMIAPLSGPFAQIGKDMVTGTELYLDEIGRQAAGRKIELLVEDDEGNPSVGVTKVRKLVEGDRVHLVTGGLLASTGYAIQPYVDAQKVPTTYPVMAGDDMTQRKLAKWVVRTGFSSSQSHHPFGEWVATQLKYKKIAAVAADYAFGWESLGGFQKAFEDTGGQVVQKLWVPLNTADFGPYVAQIRRDVDAVWTLFTGRLAIQFVKQYNDAGLKARIPLIGGGSTTDEAILPSMGDEAIGVITPLHYSAALDTPANKGFVAAFERKAGRVASPNGETCYTNARWIVEAVKAIGGKVEDREAFLAALRKVELGETPRGPVTVDRLGNTVQNIYVRKIERVGGKLQNTVIHTFPAVSQFWKYNPDEFLKQPVYSRDFPPCKYC
jgi:branched-chain amino acid transport system substrate-binding protein